MVTAGTLMLCWPCSAALATVTEYTDKPQWESAAGSFTTIHFTELPDNSLVTGQYAPLGVTFTDGSDYVYHSSSFIIDGAGLNGAINSVSLAFGNPMHSIAIDFPGLVLIRLFVQGQLTYTSSDFGGSGLGHFAGLISDAPFDAAQIFGPSGNVFIDDLHFGTPIPGPGMLSTIALAALLAGPRRRR
jgi:hypothetical protein